MLFSVRLLIFTIFIFHSSMLYAALTPLGFELGKATLKDIKKKYKIKERTYSFGDMRYELDISAIPDTQLIYVAVWCDPTGLVQAMMITESKKVWRNLIESLLSKYELTYPMSFDEINFEREYHVQFKDKDNDSTISIYMDKDSIAENYIYDSEYTRKYFPK